MLTADEMQVDIVMRTLWDSRSYRKTPRTDEEWEHVKRSPIHQVTLRSVRREALEMIEAGEFA